MSRLVSVMFRSQQALQLAFMATRYFERAEELQREIRFQQSHGRDRAEVRIA
jgi:hypothetical protein